MDIEKKREFLANRIYEELEKDPVKITFSSRKLTGARTVFVVSKSVPSAGASEEASYLADELKKEDFFTSQSAEPAEQEAQPRSDRLTEAEKKRRKLDDPDLPKKERERLRKEYEKEERRNRKAYEKMRKDIKKRGFETGVLKRLNDPADIYSMSDDEIKEVEVAGVINEDGFYSFVFPEDYGREDISRVSTKSVLMIAGFAVAIILLMVIFINNIFNLL